MNDLLKALSVCILKRSVGVCESAIPFCNPLYAASCVVSCRRAVGPFKVQTVQVELRKHGRARGLVKHTASQA
jgi:hypothetical protein